LRAVFIFGFLPDSPGKTVVSTALCRGVLNRGFNVAPFKPRSGHNFWYQYDACVECKREARLFCEDIMKLKRASRCRLPYEVLNPVDALMAPLDAGVFLRDDYIRGMYLRESDTFSHLLVERYTSGVGGKTKSVICVNETSLSHGVLGDRGYIEALMEKADDVVTVSDVSEWASVFERFGPRSISMCRDRIGEDYELMVVEGFNDAVCPAPGMRYEVVVGVGPGIVALYDPSDFDRAIKVRSTIGSNPMELRSNNIVELIKPDEILTVPALKSKDLVAFDRLSQKLDELVVAILKRFE
jgi:predicted P-loop ATPase/GTPase